MGEVWGRDGGGMGEWARWVCSSRWACIGRWSVTTNGEEGGGWHTTAHQGTAGQGVERSGFMAPKGQRMHA
jgi:hypothetical protein